MTLNAGRGAFLGLLIAASSVLAQDSASRVDEGRDSLRAGKYKEAIAILAKVSPADSQWTSVQNDIARAYATIGKYDDAELAARHAADSKAGIEAANTLGEILQMRGKRAAAESSFTRAVTGHASDSLTAALNLAVLHFERGERDRALKEFDKFIDVYNASLGENLSSDDLVAVGTAVQYLGVNDPQLFKDALKALDRAILVDPNNANAKDKLGELFESKYNFEDAQRTFDDVLSTNPYDPRALIGASKTGLPHADTLLQHAFAVNPESVPGRIEHATMLLGLEDYAGAQLDIDRALKVDPTSEEALSVAAAIKFLTHDQAGFEAARQRVLALDPSDGKFYGTMSQLASSVRLYKAAADFAAEGVKLDAKAWGVWNELGMNQLRLGQIAEGRKSLETSFAGDPYNVWVKNTLDLLDTYKNYDLISSDRFQFMIGKEEAPVLSIYMKDLAERAYSTFSAHYAFTPQPPIRIEVYRSHADFSVRTTGMNGLGALGVSFGNTLAFDSPAAKDNGPFNWGSTMWHELAHTFTMGSTDNRVPRWFTEGLSVYEEHHGRAGWGFTATPQFLWAFKSDSLVPVSRMNDGFMHPAYAQQVIFSYYQASLVCDLLARDYGDSVFVKMLRGYKDGLTTDEVFKRVLNTDIKVFDKKFDDYLRTRFAAVLPSIKAKPLEIPRSASAEDVEQMLKTGSNDFNVQWIAGAWMLEHDSVDRAIQLEQRASAMFPEFGNGQSPYAILAAAYQKKGDARGEADALTKLTSLDETEFVGLDTLSSLLEKLGDRKGAVDALDRAVYINPFEPQMHQRLAALAQTAGDKQMVVRERAAVVALGPVDKADAYYQLALAQHDAGDDVHARTSVLRALEDAPNYEKAQTLLLALYDARTNQAGAIKP